MRLRNIPGADEVVANSPYCIQNPTKLKGIHRKEIFGNDNPLHIEIGMGKGQFITTLAMQNPNINYIGIERYTSVLLRAIQKVEGCYRRLTTYKNVIGSWACDVFLFF